MIVTINIEHGFQGRKQATYVARTADGTWHTFGFTASYRGTNPSDLARYLYHADEIVSAHQDGESTVVELTYGTQTPLAEQS